MQHIHLLYRLPFETEFDKKILLRVRVCSVRVMKHVHLISHLPLKTDIDEKILLQEHVCNAHMGEARLLAPSLTFVPDIGEKKLKYDVHTLSFTMSPRPSSTRTQRARG